MRVQDVRALWAVHAEVPEGAARRVAADGGRCLDVLAAAEPRREGRGRRGGASNPQVRHDLRRDRFHGRTTTPVMLYFNKCNFKIFFNVGTSGGSIHNRPRHRRCFDVGEPLLRRKGPLPSWLA